MILNRPEAEIQTIEERLGRGMEILFEMERRGERSEEYERYLGRWSELLERYQELQAVYAGRHRNGARPSSYHGRQKSSYRQPGNGSDHADQDQLPSTPHPRAVTETRTCCSGAEEKQ